MWRLSKHAAVDTEGGEPVNGYSEMETECKRPDIIRSPNIRTSVCLSVCPPLSLSHSFCNRTMAVYLR